MKNKPFLNSSGRKHPTIKVDAVAYTSGSNDTFDAAYTTYMKSVETLDLAVRTIANVLSLCKMQAFTEDSDGKFTKIPIDNIDFDFPNATDSRVDFMRKLAVNIWTQGAALIITEEDIRGKAGKFVNFYNVDMAKISAATNGVKLITEFIYAGEDGSETTYPAEKCIYINDSIDPSNLLYSLSRLLSLNDVLLMQAGAVGQAKGMLTGGSKKASIISAEQPISTRNMNKIKTEFDTFMESATSSSFFMNTKLDVQTIGNAMTGKEVIELFTTLNEAILKHFAIPSFLLGVTSKGANKTEEVSLLLRTFFNSQLAPVLTNVELQFTRFFREQLGLVNVTIKFDYSELSILKMPEEIAVDLTIKKHKAGLITLNEARKMLDLKERDDESASKIYMPAYLLGGAPVSYDDYDTDLERFMNINSVSSSEESLPSGSSGDEDNVNTITDSRGGDAEKT